MAKTTRKFNERPDDTGGGTAGRQSSSRPVFIDGFLTNADKEWLAANSAKKLELVSELLNAIEDEYTVSVKFDGHSQRFLATLTCRVPNHHNSGCILTSRGATSVDTLYALAYRHFYKFDGKWRDSVSDSESLWD